MSAAKVYVGMSPLQYSRPTTTLPSTEPLHRRHRKAHGHNPADVISTDPRVCHAFGWAIGFLLARLHTPLAARQTSHSILASQQHCTGISFVF